MIDSNKDIKIGFVAFEKLLFSIEAKLVIQGKLEKPPKSVLTSGSLNL